MRASRLTYLVRLALALPLATGAVLAALLAEYPGQTRQVAVNLLAPPAGRPRTMDRAYRAELSAYLRKNGITRFSARDVTVQGRANGSLFSPAYGRNSLPPRDLWDGALPTLKVLEAFMERCDCAITVLSGYRSPAYNLAIDGATRSQHMNFVAIDFYASKGHPGQWVRILRDLRRSGLFAGGIGKYQSFVHVDTRGTNANWDLSRR